jgi:hypothetical protein
LATANPQDAASINTLRPDKDKTLSASPFISPTPLYQARTKYLAEALGAHAKQASSSEPSQSL